MRSTLEQTTRGRYRSLMRSWGILSASLAVLVAAACSPAETVGPLDAASITVPADPAAGATSSTSVSLPPSTTASTVTTTASAVATTTHAEPPPADDGPAASGGEISAAASTEEDVPPAEPLRPPWLGTRPLELRPDGFGVVVPTPPELIGRAFPPSTSLGPGGEEFTATSGPVPDHVLARSTWNERCPVGVEDLSYLTMTYRGFDGASHLGEMIVHESVADSVIDVFRQLFEAGFPVEEMRVVSSSELDLPPTGDGNNTTSFVCRAVTGASSWSQHAYGLAIDLNPFHNPYSKGDLVLPELASHYLDRTLDQPGMIHESGPAVAAFDSIGWGWGGRWRSLIDLHHFSANGR